MAVDPARKTGVEMRRVGSKSIAAHGRVGPDTRGERENPSPSEPAEIFTSLHNNDGMMVFPVEMKVGCIYH